MKDRGDDIAINDVNLIFGDDATDLPSLDGPIVSGRYQPTGLSNDGEFLWCSHWVEAKVLRAIAGNSRLQDYAQGLVDQAVEQFEQTKEKQRLFTAFRYKAQSWDRHRTIVAKAECHDEGTNLRFIITSLPVTSLDEPRCLYDDYVQRGESEQRMDELKNGLHMDRLSCHRFMANFWRLLLHTAACNLLNALRDHEEVPEELRCAQPAT